MSEAKNACPGAGTSEQAQERSSCGSSSPALDYIARGEVIASFLSRGSENARALRELECLTGWSGRAIRRQIEKERRDGVPILSDSRSDCGGYYLPGDDHEIRRFIGSMRGRAREILETAAAVEAGGRGNGN